MGDGFGWDDIDEEDWSALDDGATRFVDNVDGLYEDVGVLEKKHSATTSGLLSLFTWRDPASVMSKLSLVWLLVTFFIRWEWGGLNGFLGVIVFSLEDLDNIDEDALDGFDGNGDKFECDWLDEDIVGSRDVEDWLAEKHLSGFGKVVDGEIEVFNEVDGLVDVVTKPGFANNGEELDWDGFDEDFGGSRDVEGGLVEEDWGSLGDAFVVLRDEEHWGLHERDGLIELLSQGRGFGVFDSWDTSLPFFNNVVWGLQFG